MSAAMQWFRLYSRIVDDDKIRLLAFEDRWHFVALCCLKSDGLLDEPDSDIRARRIAVRLGVQVRELEEIARRLREVGLVDEGLNPLAWDELQFRSDSSTARVQAYRKKLKKQARNGTKRQRNVSETAQETETDTDTEELEPKGSCASGDARVTMRDVFDGWNETATDCGLQTVRWPLSDRRQRRLRVMLRQYPTAGPWERALQHIRGSPFLRGEKGDWKADFEFFLQAKSFEKLTEGSYG